MNVPLVRAMPQRQKQQFWSTTTAAQLLEQLYSHLVRTLALVQGEYYNERTNLRLVETKKNPLPALPPFPRLPSYSYKHQPSLTLFPLLGFCSEVVNPILLSHLTAVASPRRGKKKKRKYRSPVQFGYLYSGKVLITWIYSGDNL